MEDHFTKKRKLLSNFAKIKAKSAMASINKCVASEFQLLRYINDYLVRHKMKPN